MKTFFLFIAGLLIYSSGLSQTQNVGIGIANPIFKLDVRNGSINTDSVYRIGTTTVLAVPGDGNLFVGKNAGKINTSFYNTFNGEVSGFSNTTGSSNSFFGQSSGYDNTAGEHNSFFGRSAGNFNTTGNNNSFFGRSAGYINTTGTLNTALGSNANVNTGALSNASAIGANAKVDCNNCMVLGSVNNVNGATSDVNIGIGVNSPNARLSISTNGSELGGLATGNTLRTNAGPLSSAVNSELSLANIGFMTGNNSSLAVRAFRTSAGSDWTTTSLLLEYDVDDTPRAGGYLALSSNGNIGIGTNNPAFKLDVAYGSINTNSDYRIDGNTVLAARPYGSLFVGTEVGMFNNGSFNTFAGIGTGYSNTYGSYNSFFGFSAGEQNTIGNYNSFFGFYAGLQNTLGEYNSFFGFEAGRGNSIGVYNSFFGYRAGYSNTTGNDNSFFGLAAGFANTTGDENSFFGYESGRFNSTGTKNSFFGLSSGRSNSTGNENSFFGMSAGNSNSTGNDNSFFGFESGYTNTTGSLNSFSGLHSAYNNSSGSENTAQGAFALLENSTGTRNTAVGYHADVNTGALTNATAIGANARADCSNCMVLGSVVNQNGATSNINVGIGVNAPDASLHVARGTGGFGTAAFHGTTHISHFNFSGTENTYIRAGKNDGIVFINDIPGGKVIIGTGSGEKLTVNGDVCIFGLLNAMGGYGTCSDSRYKTNLTPLTNSLYKVLQLNGLYYYWKKDLYPEKKFSDERQIGFLAQELEELFPEMVQTDTKGYKSVDYSRMTPVLVEAIKEQQTQIDAFLNHDKEQQQQIDHQQKQIDELKKLVLELAAKK